MAGLDGLAIAEACGGAIVCIILTLKALVISRTGCVVALPIGKAFGALESRSVQREE